MDFKKSFRWVSNLGNDDNFCLPKNICYVLWQTPRLKTGLDFRCQV